MKHGKWLEYLRKIEGEIDEIMNEYTKSIYSSIQCATASYALAQSQFPEKPEQKCLGAHAITMIIID